MLERGYTPSLWRIQKTVRLLVLLVLLAGPDLDDLLNASERFHRLLAEPRRKRKRQMALQQIGLS